MIRSLLVRLAKRSHDLRVQCGLATIYGLISIFGHVKTGIILYKLAKSAKKKASKNATM